MQANAPPPNVHMLAGQYTLGAPLSMHRRPIPLWQPPVLLAVSPIGLVVAVLAGSSLLSAPRFNPSILVLFVLALLAGLSCLAAGFYLLKYSRFRAWECDAGFLELNERGALSAALRWDHIQTVWHRVKVSTYSRGGTRYEHTYSVQGPDGKEVTLNYPDLWQRIEYEFVRLHLPQALATIQTGSAVSFGGVVVSAQGIASGPVIYYYQHRTMPNTKPPWQLAWQAIPWITVRDGMIEFTPPERGLISYTPPIFARLSDVPNLCLLRALVQALTNGQMRWIEVPRRGISVENSQPAVQ